ncbi:MAG: hypothetical protein WCT51_04855 [Candidatus Shapirobacteria bacterium]|jgi:hypothetical protein
MNYSRVASVLVVSCAFIAMWIINGNVELAIGAIYGIIIGALAFFKNN